MTEISKDLGRLRQAVRVLACAPQAQRRYVQMGAMRYKIEDLDRIGARVDELVSAGALGTEDAVQITQLRDQVLGELGADPSFLEEADAGSREFLYGTALENERWHAIRHAARDLYRVLSDAEPERMAATARRETV